MFINHCTNVIPRKGELIILYKNQFYLKKTVQKMDRNVLDGASQSVVSERKSFYEFIMKRCRRDAIICSILSVY